MNSEAAERQSGARLLESAVGIQQRTGDHRRVRSFVGGSDEPVQPPVGDSRVVVQQRDEFTRRRICEAVHSAAVSEIDRRRDDVAVVQRAPDRAVHLCGCPVEQDATA